MNTVEDSGRGMDGGEGRKGRVFSIGETRQDFTASESRVAEKGVTLRGIVIST